MPIAVIVAEDFEPYIGEDFVLPGSAIAPPMPFRLMAVERGRRHMPDATRDPFTVSFRAPSLHVFEQGLYRLTHASFDYQDIFLVPVGQSEAGTDYNAYYN